MLVKDEKMGVFFFFHKVWTSVLGLEVLTAIILNNC